MLMNILRIVSLAIAVCFGMPVMAASVPNVFLIYADELGYGDVQCYNPARGKIKTPHIDRLATEGM